MYSSPLYDTLETFRLQGPSPGLLSSPTEQVTCRFPGDTDSSYSGLAFRPAVR